MTTANREQTAHWNNTDEVGHWITEQAQHDRMLEPFGDLVLDAARLVAGDRVLDVGCGCGATTRLAAQRVAPGSVVGVDLSGPMLERARADARAQGITNVDFEQADAQVHQFDANHYDAVISRFGIMFFDDPIAAFRNLRGATRRGGRLAFVCWQRMVENAWLAVPGAAIAQHVALPAPAAPGAPGMLAFADAEHTRRVLDEAGWRDVTLTSHHVPILVGGGGSVDDAVRFLQRTPLGRAALAEADEATAARAIEAVRVALAEHLDDDGVRLDSAVWVVDALA